MAAAPLKAPTSRGLTARQCARRTLLTVPSPSRSKEAQPRRTDSRVDLPGHQRRKNQQQWRQHHERQPQLPGTQHPQQRQWRQQRRQPDAGKNIANKGQIRSGNGPEPWVRATTSTTAANCLPGTLSCAGNDINNSATISGERQHQCQQPQQQRKRAHPARAVHPEHPHRRSRHRQQPL